MRNHLLIPIFVAGLAAAGLRAETSAPFKEKTLSNGLHVYVIENRSVPLATIDITARNGSFTEPQQFAGLSHLYEHMFFKANKKYASQEQFMDRIRELGISFNGYTTEEFVTYFFTLPSKNLTAGVSFMADAIVSPKFDEKELERERQVVLGEFDRDQAQPLFKLEYALDSAEWGANVVRKQALGQRPTIEAATREQMIAIQHKFYIPNNCAFIVSGDVDADTVFALAEHYLGGWQRSAPPFPTYNPPPFQPMKTRLIKRDANIPDVQIEQRFWGPSVVWRGSSLGNDKEVCEADLLTTLLSLETSHFQNVFVDSGVVLSANAGYNMQHNVGPFEFDFDAKPENVKRALALLKEEIHRMTMPGYYTADEIETAKQQTKIWRLYNEENPANFAIGIMPYWWGIAGIPFYRNYIEQINTITAQDLADFAKKYLTQSYVLGVGASQETLDQLSLDPKVVLQ